MGLPEAQGYDALFVTCCHHTKQAHIIPMSTTTSARGLATLFRDHVWKLHGLPETTLSDRGPQFGDHSLRTPNSLHVVTLGFPQSRIRDWNTFDVTLSNADCISEAHLSLMMTSSPGYTKEL